MDRPSAKRRRDTVVVWIVLLVLVVGVGLVILTFALMVNYDLRHADADSYCAPVEQSGRVLYPCGHGAAYQVAPSGVSLLIHFITDQPEPELRWVTTPQRDRPAKAVPVASADRRSSPIRRSSRLHRAQGRLGPPVRPTRLTTRRPSPGSRPHP